MPVHDSCSTPQLSLVLSSLSSEHKLLNLLKQYTEFYYLSSCLFVLVGGRPLVVSDPLGAVAQQFMVLGAAVVQEVAKLKLKPRNSVR